MGARRAINHADSLLSKTPAPEVENDRRWQAIFRVGSYVESNPEEVWQFVRRWGTHGQEDLRDAVACCLLEHLLEHHFDLIFPRVRQTVKKSKRFADTFVRCWKLGQAEAPENSGKFDELRAWCRKRRASRVQRSPARHRDEVHPSSTCRAFRHPHSHAPQ